MRTRRVDILPIRETKPPEWQRYIKVEVPKKTVKKAPALFRDMYGNSKQLL